MIGYVNKIYMMRCFSLQYEPESAYSNCPTSRTVQIRDGSFPWTGEFLTTKYDWKASKSQEPKEVSISVYVLIANRI